MGLIGTALARSASQRYVDFAHRGALGVGEPHARLSGLCWPHALPLWSLTKQGRDRSGHAGPICQQAQNKPRVVSFAPSSSRRRQSCREGGRRSRSILLSEPQMGSECASNRAADEPMLVFGDYAPNGPVGANKKPAGGWNGRCLLPGKGGAVPAVVRHRDGSGDQRTVTALDARIR